MTTEIILSTVEHRATTGSTVAVANAQHTARAVVTASETWDEVPLTAPGAGLFWIVKAIAGSIVARFGDEPETAGSEWIVREGYSLEVAALPGQKIAVKTYVEAQ